MDAHADPRVKPGDGHDSEGMDPVVSVMAGHIFLVMLGLDPRLSGFIPAAGRNPARTQRFRRNRSGRTHPSVSSIRHPRPCATAVRFNPGFWSEPRASPPFPKESIGQDTSRRVLISSPSGLARGSTPCFVTRWKTTIRG